MIGIIDYGMGNLHSVENACHHLGLKTCISSNPEVLKTCDKLILPGVGSIKDCMDNLNSYHLPDFIRQQVQEEKKPILGICLGMQAFYESSEENGGVKTLGLLPGKVIRMTDSSVRIPHIGWNQLEFAANHPLKAQLSDKPWVYFDHSYYASCFEPEHLIAFARHGSHLIPALTGYGNILGAQFHPEKSAQDGLAILTYFGKELS